MSNEKTDSLTDKLNSSETGAVTFSRYRYQAKYAALLSIKLLDESIGVEEIFCEHHEDILVKRKDGLLKGIQVKTRDTSRDPFKSNEVQIVNAITAFVELESDNPDAFSDFTIASNYNFYKAQKDKNNLEFLLEKANEAYNKKEDVEKILKTLIGAVKNKYKDNTKKECSDEIIIKVLAKTRLEVTPSLDSIEQVILVELGSLPELSSKTVSELKPIMKSLFDITTDASDSEYDSSFRYCFSLAASPNLEKQTAEIEGKKLNKEKVSSLINLEISKQSIIRTQITEEITSLPSGTDILKIKMTEGGISEPSIENAIQQKYSTEYLLIDWLYQFGTIEANKRYNHIKTIVRNECAESYDLARNLEEKYGPKMLISVREKLKARYTEEKHLFFNCTYEHLLGFASLLTEACVVWWSEIFEIPKGSEA